MIIYNITTQLTWAIHDAWLEWMKLEHIPQIMQTGKFSKHYFSRLQDVEEEQGPTYSLQFFAESRADIDSYIADYAPGLRNKSFEKWGDQFFSFRTLMEVIH
jgi:hypothetical protein